MNRTLAGVDGCRAGWIAAVRDGNGQLASRVFPAFAELVAGLGPGAVIAVDMPIGLPERIQGTGRVAEQAGRAVLTKRKSSLFSIPARAAVEASTGPLRDPAERKAAWDRACRLARSLSDPPRAFSIQAFGILPKIAEIDCLLRAEPELAARVIESHPEIAFAVLNEGAEMRHPKKQRDGGAWPGLAERCAVLLGKGLAAEFLDRSLPRGTGRDDWLDACALLLVAERYARGEARSYPDPPGRDAHGLPITIWA
ncbi:DUF429 domain-containing protein [Aureimonas psammosilenae]|uniref:DUF429 domain-containing protein n=1 Tax=Aureimonas psammosilenae TaxID=2495496 RepID=UPI001260D72D|nr:DUF429 domain-containing protein [Aureimonas psammosilenae]